MGWAELGIVADLVGQAAQRRTTQQARNEPKAPDFHNRGGGDGHEEQT